MEKGTNRSSRLIALACRVRSSTLDFRPLGTPELSAAGSIYEFFNSAFHPLPPLAPVKTSESAFFCVNLRLIGTAKNKNYQTNPFGIIHNPLATSSLRQNRHRVAPKANPFLSEIRVRRETLDCGLHPAPSPIQPLPPGGWAGLRPSAVVPIVAERHEFRSRTADCTVGSFL